MTRRILALLICLCIPACALGQAVEHHADDCHDVGQNLIHVSSLSSLFVFCPLPHRTNAKRRPTAQDSLPLSEIETSQAEYADCAPVTLH